MFESLRDYFRRRIAPAGETQGPAGPDRLEIATCALLLEVAHADEDFDESERALVREVASRRFGLAPAEADELVELADRERRRSTDLYGFARLIGGELERADRLAVLRLLWRVVYSDGRLEAHEDALMHKLARLLGLRHEELIAVKLQVKRELELDGRPDGGAGPADGAEGGGGTDRSG